MNKQSFNLVDESWIPATLENGERSELSLSEAFRKMEDVAEVSGEAPQVSASLYRLLIAIFQRAVKIDSPQKWKDAWGNRSRCLLRVRKYLEEQHGRFDLYDAKFPFLQSLDADLYDAKKHPLHRLSFIQDNNAVVFHHVFDARPAEMKDAEVARWLLAFQQFAVGGGCSKPFYFSDSPIINQGGCCFIVKGSNLFETILLNLSTEAIRSRDEENEDEENEDGEKNIKEDVACWERDFALSPTKDGTIPAGYCDALVWQSRRILIDPDSRTVSILQGLKADKDARQPMALYDAGGKPVKVFHGVWKNYHALFSSKKSGKVVGALLSACNALLDPRINYVQDLVVSMYALQNKQAKVVDVYEEHHPLYGVFSRNGVEPWIKIFVEQVSLANECIKYAARKTKSADEKDKCRDYDLHVFPITSDFFWPTVQRSFWEFIDRVAKSCEGLSELDFDKYMQSALTEWKQIVLETARKTLERAIDALKISPAIVCNAVWPKFYNKAKKEGLMS